jgi:lipoprotein-anchoring transpeptidase ErfK/SrfK
MRFETKCAVLTISALATLWLLAAPATAQWHDDNGGYYPPDYQPAPPDYSPYPAFPENQPYEPAPPSRRRSGYAYGQPDYGRPSYREPQSAPSSGPNAAPTHQGGVETVYNPPPDDAAAAASPRTRQVVDYSTTEAPGTIIVDTISRHLYLVQPGGRAIAYGIGVGREGFAWKGIARVGSKQEWPRWFPPDTMLQRRPDLPTEMDGGLGNPLGARALYLYEGKTDTLFRIHGTNEPDTIGKAVSSGCIRMMNSDVMDLYERVPVGTRVVVL